MAQRTAADTEPPPPPQPQQQQHRHRKHTMRGPPHRTPGHHHHQPARKVVCAHPYFRRNLFGLNVIRPNFLRCANSYGRLPFICAECVHRSPATKNNAYTYAFMRWHVHTCVHCHFRPVRVPHRPRNGRRRFAVRASALRKLRARLRVVSDGI